MSAGCWGSREQQLREPFSGKLVLSTAPVELRRLPLLSTLVCCALPPWVQSQPLGGSQDELPKVVPLPLLDSYSLLEKAISAKKDRTSSKVWTIARTQEISFVSTCPYPLLSRPGTHQL